MRGPPCRSCFSRLSARITPANAGTTFWDDQGDRLDRDHPRECGDHRRSCVRWRRSVGSPPRMRGPHERGLADARDDRITPANAGTTRVAVSISARPRDHPRECGDHGQHRHASSKNSGSPPRMRGPLAHTRAGVAVGGITPANAGTTLDLVGGGHDGQDHPRECGDHGEAGAPVGREQGSPPRMRGPPPPHGRATSRSGITPANAGTTLNYQQR